MSILKIDLGARGAFCLSGAAIGLHTVFQVISSLGFCMRFVVVAACLLALGCAATAALGVWLLFLAFFFDSHFDPPLPTRQVVLDLVWTGGGLLVIAWLVFWWR